MKQRLNPCYGLNGVLTAGPEKDDRRRFLKVEEICQYLDENTDVIKSQSEREKFIEKYVEAILDKVYGTNKSRIERNLRFNEEVANKDKNEQILQCYNNIEKSVIQNVLNGTEINQELITQSTDFLNNERVSKVREGAKKSGDLIFFEDKSTERVYEQLTNLSKLLPESQFNKVVQVLVKDHNLHYNKEGEKDAEVK